MQSTQWFADHKWGVFCHYLGQDSQSAAEWNAQVDAFDVDGLARQLASVRAPYFFITLGQGSGHYCAPNSLYTSLTGMSPGKCSQRDLVSDLAGALAPHGIDLLVYTAADGPHRDLPAREALKLGPTWNDPGIDFQWAGRDDSAWARFRWPEFMHTWEDIHAHWSRQWGAKVKGWWVDGCYGAKWRYPDTEAPNLHTFAKALRAGNPDAIVAFNPGVCVPVIAYSDAEDFTAGEISTALPDVPGPSLTTENGHEEQYHILSYLGESWCKGQPRFPDTLVQGYTQHAASKGAVITWDVPIGKTGLIPAAFLEQLRGISLALA